MNQMVGKSIEIMNEKMKQSILEVVADTDTRKILDCVFDKSMTLLAIKKKKRIPQTTFYRKVKPLIEKGFLFENGTKKTWDGKTLIKYRCLFSAVRISGFYPIRVFVQINKLVGDKKEW